MYMEDFSRFYQIVFILFQIDADVQFSVKSENFHIIKEPIFTFQC